MIDEFDFGALVGALVIRVGTLLAQYCPIASIFTTVVFCRDPTIFEEHDCFIKVLPIDQMP
jgi:hypothetical protein